MHKGRKVIALVRVKIYLCWVMNLRFIGCLPIFLLLIFFGRTWGILSQQESPIAYITSDNFSPDGLQAILQNYKPNSEERKLLEAYLHRLQGRRGYFIQTMEGLTDQRRSFEGSPFLKFFYHLQLSCYYEEKGQPFMAKTEAFNSQQLAGENNEKLWNSWAYSRLGQLYSNENNQDSSSIYHKKSVEFSKRCVGKLPLAMSLHEFAMSNHRFLQIEQAVQQELLALELVQTVRNDYYASLFYQLIAKMSLNAGNVRESENYLLKSNQKNRRKENQLIALENALISYHLLLKKAIPGEVLLMLPSTLKLLEKSHAEILYGEAWLLYGQATSASGSPMEAMNAYSKALAFFEQQNAPQKMAEAYHLIGVNSLGLKKAIEAEKNLNKSINIYTNLKDNRGIHENYYALSEVYVLMGKPQLAYNYLKKYTAFLQKTSFSIDSKAVEELTQTHSREERERLINDQEEKLTKGLKEKEILQLQSDRQLLGIVIVVVVFFLSGLILFFVNRQRNTLQEQRETEMSQTLLRSQMNPHFIFNALSVIQSYIYENTPEKTSSFLVNFSRLIRLILENSPKEFITIDIEREILTKYLTTQKLRFEDRFNFELRMDEDLIAKRALIPPMITQPFVENSIEHGQLHTISEGMIQIIMREQEGMLIIEVNDNGVGREKAAKIKTNTNHKSMAMDITRERIRILNKKYKGKGTLEISDFSNGSSPGTKVVISLPLMFENTIFERNEKNTHH
jgi:hypothetical protein